MGNFTPGPWNVSRLATPNYAPEFAIYADGGTRALARVSGADSEANARLIAAAPKLLEACKVLLSATMHRDHPAESAIAIAAINEATGE